MKCPQKTACDVALLVSYSGDGGMERVFNMLAAGFVAAGLRVDVVILRSEGGHFSGLPQGVRPVKVRWGDARLAGPDLVRYLRESQPSILLAAKNRGGQAAIKARDRSGCATRVFIGIGNTLSQSLRAHGRLTWRLRRLAIRKWYPLADGIIASSQGVADDIAHIADVAPDRIHVAYNPVVTPSLYDQAEARAPHPWLKEKTKPVYVSVGRLTEQKDFATLIRAFAELREQKDARLLILGEGPQRSALSRLAQDLGLEEDIEMPGFVDNPYAYMTRASVFVLSSAWEGFGNVLAEAMALGLPMVSTDCPSGPREILADGKYGWLVQVGNASALASAMLQALDRPPEPEHQRGAAQRFTQERSAARYMEILDLHPASARVN